MVEAFGRKSQQERVPLVRQRRVRVLCQDWGDPRVPAHRFVRCRVGGVGAFRRPVGVVGSRLSEATYMAVGNLDAVDAAVARTSLPSRATRVALAVWNLDHARNALRRTRHRHLKRRLAAVRRAARDLKPMPRMVRRRVAHLLSIGSTFDAVGFHASDVAAGLLMILLLGLLLVLPIFFYVAVFGPVGPREFLRLTIIQAWPLGMAILRRTFPTALVLCFVGEVATGVFLAWALHLLDWGELSRRAAFLLIAAFGAVASGLMYMTTGALFWTSAGAVIISAGLTVAMLGGATMMWLKDLVLNGAKRLLYPEAEILDGALWAWDNIQPNGERLALSWMRTAVAERLTVSARVIERHLPRHMGTGESIVHRKVKKECARIANHIRGDVARTLLPTEGDRQALVARTLRLYEIAANGSWGECDKSDPDPPLERPRIIDRVASMIGTIALAVSPLAALVTVQRLAVLPQRFAIPEYFYVVSLIWLLGTLIAHSESMTRSLAAFKDLKNDPLWSRLLPK